MKKLFVGLTVMSLMAMTVAPALASGGSDIEVENSNKAYVSNDVTVGANTGSNWAYGGDGGNGGTTGKTIATKGGTATGGDVNGGNGGANSGSITTGDAYAKAKVVNVVNTNDTKIKATCTTNCPLDDVEVENRSKARVDNLVGVVADAGNNGTMAGNGGEGGTTGKTIATKGGNATGGDAKGGNGGANSGSIDTGSAYSKAKVVNVVNKNITRIRR